jgi:hypothetical protein
MRSRITFKRLQFLSKFKQAKTSKGTDAQRDSLTRFSTLGFLGQTILRFEFKFVFVAIFDSPLCGKARTQFLALGNPQFL